MFAFTLVALMAVANAQIPNLSNLFPNNGGNVPAPSSNNNNNGGNSGGNTFQLDNNILANLGKLLQGLNGGSGAGGASVDANGQLGFSSISEFLNNAGVKLNGAGDSLKSALSNIKLPDLNFQGAELKDVQSLLAQFSGLKLLDGKLTSQQTTTDLNGNLVTAQPVEIDNVFKVLQGKVLQTVNALVVKANASLSTDSNAGISAAVTQFLGGNADFTKGNFTTGLLLFNEAKSKILGSFQVVGDHLAQVAADAKLQLGNTPADPNAPNPIAQILAKFNVSGDLSFDGPTNLVGAIGGNGTVSIKSLLDLTAANGAAVDSETLLKAKTLILDKLADLKLKVQSNSGILANITQGLDFGNGKIDISIPDDVKQTVLKFLHGSATGKAQITIDGKSVVDVTSGAPTASAPPAGTVDANGKVWTVNYGDKETTLELKDEKEVYAASSGALVDATTHSGVASTTIAVAAVVAAIAVMN